MSELSNAKKRIDWIDFAKGIGAFLVVLGHVSSLNHNLILIIFSFHMPLFFILSGYVYKNKPDFKKHFIAKFKGIFVPFLVADFIDIIRIIIRQCVNFSHLTFGQIISRVTFFSSMPLINIPLWFLFVLFEIEIVYYFIFKADILLKFCTLIITISLSFFISTSFYFGLGIALRALIFFIIGDLLKNIDLNALKTKQKGFLLAAFLFLAPVWLKTAIDNNFVNLLRVSSGDSYFAYLFCAFAGSMTVIAISLLVNKLPFINYLGSQSLYLLICQNWFWSLYRNFIRPKIHSEHLLAFLNSKIIGALTIAVCITIASLIISYPVSRYKANKKKKVHEHLKATT